jgi:hypothetical protein
MNRKIMTAITILCLIAWLMPASIASANQPIDYQPVDVGPRIRGWEATPERIAPVSQAELAAEAAAAEAIVNASATDCITASKYFLILNDYTGRYQVTTFNLMGDSLQKYIDPKLRR